MKKGLVEENDVAVSVLCSMIALTRIEQVYDFSRNMHLKTPGLGLVDRYQKRQKRFSAKEEKATGLRGKEGTMSS